MNAAPSQYDHVKRGQLLLADTKRLTRQTFEAVALNGQFHVLFADDQSDPGVAAGIEARKREHTFGMDLEISLFEDVTEIPGA